MKRAFDIVVSSVGLILLLPFFVVLAILIKIDDPGPVFFGQKRIGKDFKPFPFTNLERWLRTPNKRVPK